jgi:hypothetical protein
MQVTQDGAVSCGAGVVHADRITWAKEFDVVVAGAGVSPQR